MAYDLVGLGELLWDCLPAGRVMGGAPGNVVFHANQLGLNAVLATRVGRDADGEQLLDQVEAAGMAIDLVQRDPARPTSLVQVELDTTGSAAYTFTEDCAWDALEATPPWLEACRSARAICFGSLAQRGATSHGAIIQCLEASRRAQTTACRLFDVNLRPPFVNAQAIRASFEYATILKLNDHEWPQILELVQGAPTSQGVPEKFQWDGANRLFGKYPDLRLICITRGGEGLVLASREEVLTIPGQPITVVDTVGAGDATSAGLIFGVLSGWKPEKTGRFANHLGGLVASERGATPALPLRELATNFPEQ
ncbi:MAG: carbohydrate kinase [Planctomyces sp.]|nr:carbohydrate kinase [Planctomyces sp.]